MELIAFLGSDKDNLGQLSALINRFDCSKIYIVKDKKAERIMFNEKCKFIEVNSTEDLISLRDEIRDKLKKELSTELEIALSIASGNGKEHMALISALLGIPVGVKFVAYTKKGIEFIS